MSPRKKWMEEDMAEAIRQIKSGNMGLRKAAKHYGVPKSTLSDKVAGKYTGSKPGRRPLLSSQDENSLIDHAIERAKLGIGFSKQNFLKFTGDLATRRKTPFKNISPSDKWWRLMKKRTKQEQISLRSPEGTTGLRHKGMSKNRVKMFFDALGECIKTTGISEGAHIWNMDETGVQLAHRPGKVLARKGSKTVHARTSLSREITTVIGCVNASGQRLPPHIIVKGKSKNVLKGYDTENAPPKSMISVSDSGWTKQGLAKLWFTQTFLPNIGDQRPQVLVLDGHDSHNNVEMIEEARVNDIVLVELPSHTSHWLQPLDRSVFGPFKKSWNTACQDFLNSTGLTIGHGQFFRMLKKAWESSITPENIRSGFRATGIYPLNPDAIPEDAYAPSTLYEPSNEQNASDENGIDSATNNNMQPYESIQADDNEQALLQIASADLVFETTCTSTQSNPEPHILMDIDIPCNIPVVDLPIDFLNDESAIVTPPVPSISNANTCSYSQALSVVESVMDSATVSKYNRAYSEGRDLPDRNNTLFKSWKYYKDLSKSESLKKTAVDNNAQSTSVAVLNSENPDDLFSLPTFKAAKTCRKNLNKQNYFVLTSDECYELKVKAKQDKERKQLLQAEKLVKKQEKQKKNISKLKSGK